MMVRSGIVVLLCLITGSLSLKINEVKVPSSVPAGEDATLSCDYTLEGEKEANVYVKWWRSSGDDKKAIYQRFAGKPAQVIKHIFNITAIGDDDDTIVLSDLEARHSGVYECEVSAYPNEQRRGLAMVVFTEGSGPKITVTELESNATELSDKADVDGDGIANDEDNDDDMVLVQCEATGVSPVPDLQISIDGIHYNDTEVLTEPELGLYNITSSLLVAKSTVEDQEIECNLYFEDESVAHPPYTDTLVYNSDGLTTTTEGDSEGTTEALQTTTEPPQGDSSICVGKSTVTILILSCITFASQWLIW